jgi:hypothetical protein
MQYDLRSPTGPTTIYRSRPMEDTSPLLVRVVDVYFSARRCITDHDRMLSNVCHKVGCDPSRSALDSSKLHLDVGHGGLESIRIVGDFLEAALNNLSPGPRKYTHPSEVTNGADAVVVVVVLAMTFWIAPSVFMRQSLLSVPRK